MKWYSWQLGQLNSTQRNVVSTLVYGLVLVRYGAWSSRACSLTHLGQTQFIFIADLEYLHTLSWSWFWNLGCDIGCAHFEARGAVDRVERV